MSNSKILVDIKGGFGNQIFQYCFANYLKSRGYKVFVNTEYFKFRNKDTQDNTYRTLILNEKNFNLKKINRIYLKFFKINKKINESKKIKKLFKNFNNPFYIKLKDSNYDEKYLETKYVHLDGYWQNVDYLFSQKDFLVDSLKKNKTLANSIKKIPEENTVMLIVRRGDYVEMKEDLSIDFYKKCLEVLNNRIANYRLNIFTDDEDWVKSNSIFSIAEKIYGPEDEPEGVIRIFSKMLEHKHFVIGNSTFSLLSAVISQNKDSLILVADPWFKNKKKESIYIDGSIKIPNI
tara:strand:+ start:603 stop:1475 length:873 start_codon:yes stop_codon:yes gene_type:complete